VTTDRARSVPFGLELHAARLIRYRAAAEFGLGLAAIGLFSALIFLDRTLAEYVDESDNLLGGQLIARGYRLYVDYFSQHMPAPYFAAALATLLGAHDLIGYRTLFAGLLSLVLLGVFLHFRRRLSSIFLSVLILATAVGHPMFSGYMVLADHLFAFALLILLLFVLADDVTFSVPQQLAISACCFVAVQSTLISVYPLALIGLYYVSRKYIIQRLAGSTWRAEARFVAILGAPHVVALLLLAYQGMLGTLVEQAIVFNQRFYSQYDIGSDPVSILRNSIGEFLGHAARYLRPSAWREVETVLLVSNAAGVGIAWRTRGRVFGAFYLGMVVLSRMRGPGYHGSPYFLVSFVSMALLVAFAAERVPDAFRIGFRRLEWRTGVLNALLLAYVAYAGLFIHDIGGLYVRLPRGQGLDSPFARLASAATSPSDRIWAVPNNPYVYLVSGRLPASVYAYYQPWLADSEAITARVLSDLDATRPPLVIFEADKRIEWNFPLPTPAQYGVVVYAYIQARYDQVDGQDAVLRNVYVLRDRPDVRARVLTERQELAAR
jgi:hypothetical protein